MLEEAGIHLGIDATNIRLGGGITHLSQLLQACDPVAAGISRVTVWTSQSTAAALPERPWLVKLSAPWMDASLPRRMLGQQLQLPHALNAAGCDVLFSPGGTLPAWSPVPAVTMSQNMLPFEPLEAARFGRWSLMRLKMRILRYSQSRSFRRANGLIFLTQYAQTAVSNALGGLSCPTALIPHGIEQRFLQQPRPQRSIADCTAANPFRVLYVSILMPYKHQVEVARAACLLRAQGVPIEMRFIGAPWGVYGSQFRALLDELDPQNDFLRWSGAEPFDALHGFYQRADVFVFGSSCENLPNILIEAMAAGLPIASSDRGPMTEVLGDAGVYLDPEVPASIADALHRLVGDPALRSRLAAAAWMQAKSYSWEQCARDTFAFIAQVAEQKRKSYV
jgi:glycosyltransferase involved in cell wall biosynthesis